MPISRYRDALLGPHNTSLMIERDVFDSNRNDMSFFEI